ncbi:response regulator transcription factor [Streptomyces sp. M19]
MLVADDQAVVRDGVVLLLNSAEGVEVVGQAGDGHEAVRLAVLHRPDVALVDLRMPGLDGTQVTAELSAAGLEVPVLVLTTYADDDAVLPALRAGAVGYLTKDTTGEALLDAVRDVAAGRTVLDPAVQRRLVQLVVSEPQPPAPAQAAPAQPAPAPRRPPPPLPRFLPRPRGSPAARSTWSASWPVASTTAWWPANWSSARPR